MSAEASGHSKESARKNSIFLLVQELLNLDLIEVFCNENEDQEKKYNGQTPLKEHGTKSKNTLRKPFFVVKYTAPCMEAGRM